MPVPVAHADRYVYHSTHLLNLGGVLEHGILSYNEQRQRGLEHHSIAAHSIQERRARMRVTAGPGGVVHDYVPLYFTKLSPMLLKVVLSKNVDQFLLLHFAFPIALLERDSVVFTDAAANSATPPSFFSTTSDLDRLPWNAIDLRTWGSKLNGADVKHERMAEALVHRRLDPADASFIVVWNDSIQKEVEKVYAQAGVGAPTLRFGGYDENHTFTHFRKGLPEDMLRKSIACGPMRTHHRFEEVLTADAAVQARPQPRFASVADLLSAFRSAGLSVLPETAELIDLESENEVHKHDVDTHTLRVVEVLRGSARFAALPQSDQNLVELAAYLHDIGKGPKSRWSGCSGKQQMDANHPIRSAEMLPRILLEEIHLDPATTRVLCKLLCYHDLVGDIIGKDRQRRQLVDVAETERDLDLLIALGEADMGSVAASWGWSGAQQIPELRTWVVDQLGKVASGAGDG